MGQIVSDPELQQIQLIKERMADEYAMYDLTSDQLMFISIIEAIHEKYPMPITKKFIDNFVKYSQSRDRLGRQELVLVLRGVIEYAKLRMKNVPFVEDNPKPQQKSSGSYIWLKYLIMLLLGILGFIWLVSYY